MERNVRPIRQMRIVRHSPAVVWDEVWTNFYSMRSYGPVATDWYFVIHDIVPTRQRLTMIQVASDPRCLLCGEEDTLEHRLLLCGQGPILWRWTRGVLSAFLRNNHTDIPDAWVWCPAYVIWPPQRRAAVSWFVAHFVHYRLPWQHGQSLNDFRLYLQAARRLVSDCPARMRAVGRYLEVF
jgi:hypothetical protein